MKKILFALAMLPLFAFVGCSSDDDNEKTEVYQEYNKETKLIIDEDLVEEDTKEKNIKKEQKLIVDQVEAEKIQKKTKRRKRKVKDINPK